MKILYGIQGTGNGHISRARMMARHFQDQAADVTYLLTGREKDKLFDRDIFGDLRNCRGLTFSTKNGSIDHIQTALNNNIFKFIYDVYKLDVEQFDLVLTDFEPVTAWAARFSNVPSIAFGHQYAFDHAIPKDGVDLAGKIIMSSFTPAKIRIGLHWDHFGFDILPPIVDPDLGRIDSDTEYTVVYLPFENQHRVTQLLQTIKDHRFIQYSPDLIDSEAGNVSLRQTSLHGFRHDLCGAQGVICNAGFELVSECLFIGVPVLVKPLKGQMEQQSNALALTQLNYGSVMSTIDTTLIRQWLSQRQLTDGIRFGNVAAALVKWILGGQVDDIGQLKRHLW